MELNSFLFPAPQSSYSIHGSIGDIIYIPRDLPLVEVVDDPLDLSRKEEDTISEEEKEAKLDVKIKSVIN